MFNALLDSDFVQSNYMMINRDEQVNGTAKHDLSHVLNVVHLVESVLSQLNIEKEYVQSTKIAALLHDVGCVNGKKGHALNSFYMVSKYLNENQILLNYHEEILEAIKDHCSGFESKSLMTLTLIMCDKIDITKQRLAFEGYKTVGIRQLQYIEDVKVVINGKECIVDFLANETIDFEELNSFDFLNKTFRAIYSFSKFNKLIPNIRFNGVAWSRSNT